MRSNQSPLGFRLRAPTLQFRRTRTARTLLAAASGSGAPSGRPVRATLFSSRLFVKQQIRSRGFPGLRPTAVLNSAPQQVHGTATGSRRGCRCLPGSCPVLSGPGREGMGKVRTAREMDATRLMACCFFYLCDYELEARGGIEPPNKGFADLCLTTWLPRPGRADSSSHSTTGRLY